jgi:hypothetical protein
MSVTVPMTNVDVNIPPSPSYRSEYHDQDHDVPQDSSNATNSNHNASSSNGNLNHSHDDSGITSNDGDKSNGLIVNEAHASSSKDARVTSNDEDDDDSQYSTVHDDDDNNDDDGEYEYGSNTNAEEEVIKLFVGQVPKNMEEADLFTIFEQYGPMEDVAIIRDKHTGQHRGCAFVTFLSKESAEQCERELHGTFPFEGGKRPVQVRPAGKREGECHLCLLHHDLIGRLWFILFACLRKR